MPKHRTAAPWPGCAEKTSRASRYAWVAARLAGALLLPACFLAGYESQTDEHEVRAGDRGIDASLPADARLRRDAASDRPAVDAESDARLPAAPVDAGDREARDGSQPAELDATNGASDARVLMDATGESGDGVLDALVRDALVPDALVPDLTDAELPGVDACAEPGCPETRSCEEGDDACVLSCDDAATAPGATRACVFVCAGAESCDGICRSGLACQTLCTGSTACHTRCESGATCDIRCLGSEACSADCLPGSTCNIACAGASCDNIVCKDGAVCVMR